MSKYTENLIAAILSNSEASDWENAVTEWDLFDCEEDESASGVCTCSKEGLRYLYTISNHYNGTLLHPIGSCCIKKFNRSDLSSEVDTQEQMFRLLHAIRDREFIPLTPEFFSRKLLLKLRDYGAFTPTPYNGFNGDNDYTFLLDMFNKWDKSSVSGTQRRKINGIIAFSIRPYLEKQFAGKIRTARRLSVDTAESRRLFSDVIWNRGQELAAKGAVIPRSITPSSVEAEVQGQNRYHVKIALNQSGVVSTMSCTCPYAAEGHTCKHMAAVLLCASKQRA